MAIAACSKDTQMTIKPVRGWWGWLVAGYDVYFQRYEAGSCSKVYVGRYQSLEAAAKVVDAIMMPMGDLWKENARLRKKLKRRKKR